MSDDADRDLSRLYRAGSREEPPAWLDARLLAAAAHRDEVARPGNQRASMRRWMPPLALAAVLVLSVSVVMLSDEIAGPLMGTMSAPEPTVMEPRPPAPSKLESGAGPSKAIEDVMQPRPGMSAQSAAQAPSRAEVESNAKSRKALPEHRLSRQAAEQEADPAPGRIEQRPVAPAAAAAPEPPAPQQSAQVAKEQAADARPGAASKSRMDAVPGALDAPDVQAESVAKRRAAAADLQERSNPEKWLREIERLRREGRLQEASASLDEFRRVHPLYPIPEHLK